MVVFLSCCVIIVLRVCCVRYYCHVLVSEGNDDIFKKYMFYIVYFKQMRVLEDEKASGDELKEKLIANATASLKTQLDNKEKVITCDIHPC